MSKETPSIRSWRYWRAPVLFIVVMLLFRSAIADWNQVPSASMEPSILVGDRIIVDKLAYQVRVPFTQLTLAQLGAPQRGDVVTFVSPLDGKLLVKRVLGLPGDRVAMRNNRLTINGEPARYELIGRSEAPAGPPLEFWRETIAQRSAHITWRADVRSSYQSFSERRVPADHYLMLGDNRDNSEDSRVIGLVHERLLVGRAHRVAFSVDYDRLRPRTDRFLLPIDQPPAPAVSP